MTTAPLVEEYAVSRKAFDFSQTDLCEIARNSVLTSSFDHKAKVAMIGSCYSRRHGLSRNNKLMTNVSDIRASYRHIALIRELQHISHKAGKNVTLEQDSLGYETLGGHPFPKVEGHEVKRISDAVTKAEETWFADLDALSGPCVA